ncbi:MAG: malto-oligosyltrehalose synthase [Phycisphaerales bacterium]
MSPPPSPVATYRLQLTPDFGFAAAADIVPYLADLGISHLYLSPIFEARPGSTHGYDQTGPTRLREALGGEASFSTLVHSARRHALGIIIDIVPNHMAAHHDNPWWFGLLKHGQGSSFDQFFDVDWNSASGKVVLPVLGASLDDAISKSELKLFRRDDGETVLQYFDKVFPLRDDVPVPPDNADAGDLRELLDEQHYELAFWRDGLTRINYRRFFDIADLAGLRVEDPLVFDRTHSLILDLASRGSIDGVRVDHIDGLKDPRQYLQRLRTSLNTATHGRPEPLIFAEKIFALGEAMRVGWPINGATGYEFLALAAHAITHQQGQHALRAHAAHTGAATNDFHALAIGCKEDVAATLLAPELSRLCEAAKACLDAAGHSFSAHDVRRALIAISARIGVYRTYADESGMPQPDNDRIRSAAASAAAALSNDSARHVVAPLTNFLTLSGPFASGPLFSVALSTVLKWQQFTGPLAAKGIEDTALYRDVACVVLNDVGTEPVDLAPRAGVTSLLKSLAATRLSRPLAMNATDTHDAKRSEDARARLGALTYVTPQWQSILDLAFQVVPAPTGPRLTPADISLMLHAAASIWPQHPDESPPPNLAERLSAYLIKAVREAKVHTSWTSPNPDYEHACQAAVTHFLDSGHCAHLRLQLDALAQHTSELAARLSVASLMLKALFPGTPDWYQGTECLALSLVDPDNRRPVDFAARKHFLTNIRHAWAANPGATGAGFLRFPTTDDAKLFFTWRLLRVRRELLAGGTPLTLGSLDITPAAWSWEISTGTHRCRASVTLEPHTQAPTPPDAAPWSGLDQLSASGYSPTSHLHWARVVIEDVDVVW